MTTESYSRCDSSLKKLRPILELTIEKATPEEAFQNQTLRPVLKMQHHLIISLIESQTHFGAILKKSDNYTVFYESLLTYVQKHQQLKNQIIGLCIGLLSMEEFNFYLSSSAAINKRIIQMAVKRIADTLHTQIPTL